MDIATAQEKWRLARNHLSRDWVLSLSHIADKVLKDGKQSEFAPIFWIRLYGVIAELPELIEARQRELRSSDGRPGVLAGIQADWSELDKQANVAVEEFLSALNDEDRILIEYFRNTEVHIWLEGFHGGFGLNPRLPAKRKIPGTNRERDREEIELLLERPINPHIPFAPGSVAQLLAFQFAKKLNKHIARVAAAVGVLFRD